MNPTLDDLHDSALCENRQREAVKAGLLFGRLFSARLDEQVRLEAEEDNYENALEIHKRDELYAQRGW